MLIAVTGANGFIGRHLTAALGRAGHAVRPIVRRDFEQMRLGELVAGADVVVHAAAATRAVSRTALRRSNVDLTQRVIEAATASGTPRLVLVSSQAAAGPAHARDTPVRETDAPRPVEEYGRTKLAAERLVAESGLPYVILRPAAVYGPDDRDFATLFALARRGIAIHPANREQWISLLHVDDCVAGIVRACAADSAVGGTFFLANDEPAQWKDIYALAEAAVGVRSRIDLELPRPLVEAAAGVGDLVARATGRAGLLTTEKVALSRDPFWICSNARARAGLGFSPAIALADGIARSVAGSGEDRPLR